MVFEFVIIDKKRLKMQKRTSVITLGIVVFLTSFGYCQDIKQSLKLAIESDKEMYRDENNINNPYYCEKDSDCKINYNIPYNDKCLAGCFNQFVKKDEESNKCHNLVWESFSPNYQCQCEDNKCMGKEMLCSECPRYAPPAPDWCNDGVIVPPTKDECGCYGHPICQREK